jgi:hypothetical protein
MRDESADVRVAALEAAAWHAVPGARLVARQLVDAAGAEPDDRVAALRLLGAIGGDEDRARIAAAMADAALGPERFEAAALSGDPALVPALLGAMRDPDPATAAGAGEAFDLMTGRGVPAAAVTLAAPSADPFEAEFADEVMLPDPDAAEREWRDLAPKAASAARIRRGHDVTHGAPAETAPVLDMQHRRAALLRTRFGGGDAAAASPLALERWPLVG